MAKKGGSKKKGELEKKLEAQAREHGATLSVDDEGFVLSRGQRESLRVTDETDDYTVERFLRGANA